MTKKTRAIFQKIRVSGGEWLQGRLALAALGFVGLNAVDGYLTNQVHHIALQSGVSNIESNPFLAPIVGSWVLSFKGVIGAAVLMAFAKIKKATPPKVFKWLLLGCIMFAGIVAWNLYALERMR